LLPGHAIAGWGFKTSIVMVPVVMLKARATSRISFAMGSFLSQKAMLVCIYVVRACGHSIQGLPSHQMERLSAQGKADSKFLYHKPAALKAHLTFARENLEAAKASPRFLLSHRRHRVFGGAA
jgi:hypothetical protein